MPAARLPDNEAERLAALRAYDVLDSACEESFDTIVSLAARLSSCPIALVSLVDADRQWFKARHGLDVAETPRDLAFCAHAILHPTQPLVVPDATKDLRFADNHLVTGPSDFRFYAGVPLVNQDGYALGTLCVIDREPKVFEPEAVETLVGLAQTVSTALELRRAMHHARMMALTDGLTALPNRAAFIGALSQALARQRIDGEPFSVLLLDLDGFKLVNDVLGHPTGDRVLTKVADILRSSVREEDIAARLGGDEFGLVLGGCSVSYLPMIAEQIRSAIETSVSAGDLALTVSVGAVTFREPPADETEALSATDKLLYAAKFSGKNRVACSIFPNLDGTISAS